MTTLDEIAARVDKATEGPWWLHADGESICYQFHNGDTQDYDRLAVATYPQTADAEFIAHAREDVPALVKALRAVESVHEPILALDYGVRDAPLKRQVCTGCGQDDGNWQIWPCPTIRAITGVLG